ncbi:MAG: hypothetical protein K1W06_05355 [Lachnospiraceae bacterium]
MTKVIAITIIMAYWFYTSMPFATENGIQIKKKLCRNGKQDLAEMGDFYGQVYK